METGSLFNGIMSNENQPEPKVGDGATITRWSDRSAGTIIKITKCTITVQEDKATRIDTNGMSEQQEYSYERDTEGSVYVFRKNKRGQWRSSCGKGLGIGYRKAYYDYSF